MCDVFPSVNNFRSQEKRSNKDVIITYKKPRSLKIVLYRYVYIFYRYLAIGSKHSLSGSTLPCGHCALRGNRGLHESMVLKTDFIQTTEHVIELK